MVGTCKAMQQLFRTICKVANTDTNVFITGESRTGKELTAVAIHERSPRRKGPFVAINCGAIGNHLIQLELFGYERGAFTGADQRKIGRVEEADGGTLFLDEICDLPRRPSAFAAFPAGTQNRPAGRPRPRRRRCAHHFRDPHRSGSRHGRWPVSYRSVSSAVRARGKDIEILALHVLHKFRSDGRRKIIGFAPSAIEAMYSYDWTGNVREMINRVRRAIVMAENKLITADDLGFGHCTGIESTTLAAARDAAEKCAIELSLLRHRHRHRHKLSEAAAELGISWVTLYKLMVAHGLRGAAMVNGADAG